MRCISAWAAVWVSACLIAGTAAAHQPVMDMAPRWEGGWGFQVRQEYRFTDERLDGDDKTANPLDREKRVATTWLEGIYTFKREVRATIKIPWVDQRRTSLVNGRRVREAGHGLGDIILGVPLKKYWNLGTWTANLGLTPSLRLPTGSTSDSYPVGDGSWDAGLSASLSAENFRWYTLFDVFYWKNGSGRRGIHQGDVLGLDWNLGYHPYHNNAHNLGAFVMLDFEARYESRGQDTAGTTGGRRLGLGPVLVGYWDNWMARAELKLPVWERVFGTQFSRGVQFNMGLGVTF